MVPFLGHLSVGLHLSDVRMPISSKMYHTFTGSLLPFILQSIRIETHVQIGWSIWDTECGYSGPPLCAPEYCTVA